MVILKNYFLDMFFPKFCLGCHKEGTYLCEDCFSVLEIIENHYCLCKKPQRLPQSGKCHACFAKKLNGLYFALSYQGNIVQKIIHQFKYEPYVKELAEPLSSLIIAHFSVSCNPQIENQNYILVPVPLTQKKERKRGFNQAKEIAKELSGKLNISLENDVLVKIKETSPQVELGEKERIENPRGAFWVRNAEKVRVGKILLVDDVYTTGATMEECAKVLKEAGAKEVWGVAIARG